jgi:hypothetical protein
MRMLVSLRARPGAALHTKASLGLRPVERSERRFRDGQFDRTIVKVEPEIVATVPSRNAALRIAADVYVKALAASIDRRI